MVSLNVEQTKKECFSQKENYLALFEFDWIEDSNYSNYVQNYNMNTQQAADLSRYQILTLNEIFVKKTAQSLKRAQTSLYFFKTVKYYFFIILSKKGEDCIAIFFMEKINLSIK